MKHIILVFFVLSTCIGLSQETGSQIGSRVAVVLTNGNEYIGIIKSDDGRELFLQTDNVGPLYINKSDIRAIKTIDSPKDIVAGEFRDNGPFTTRYCFTTNALGINKGENYTMLNLYGPEVHFALTDKFSMGVMTTWFGSPLVLATKYSIPTKNEKVNFSLGNLLATSGYIQSFRGFGDLLFGNVTLGNRQSNVTIGGGYFFFQGGGKQAYNQELSLRDSSFYFDYSSYQGSSQPIKGPMLSIGAITRVGAKASFVFDSMVGFFNHKYGATSDRVITEPVINPITGLEVSRGTYEHKIEFKTTQSTALFLMPGMRFQKDERRAFQVSLAGVVVFDKGETISFPVPFCTWFYKF